MEAATAGKASLAEGEYFEIPVNLYQPDEIIERDLFILYQGQYLLFRPKNLIWKQEDVNRLEQFNVRNLYIQCRTNEEANLFLEGNLSKILNAPRIGAAEKSKIIFDTANTVVAHIFEKPNSPETVKRSVSFVKNSIDFLKDKENFVQLMKLASADFSEYTHAIQTSAYAISLAQQVGLKSFNELSAIGIGSILHDLGKAKIDKKLLNKADPLSSDELQELRKHPEYGYEILRRQRSIPEAAEQIVLQHHERPRGSGYPHAVTDEIQISAKIVSIADCFDSLTSDRPWKTRANPVKAIQMMRTDLKDEYDQKLMTEFIKVLGGKS